MFSENKISWAVVHSVDLITGDKVACFSFEIEYCSPGNGMLGTAWTDIVLGYTAVIYEKSYS
jgi:hypothetical protein